MSLLISSPNTRVLDICLGNYEQDFLKSSGVQVCTIGKSWQRILCVSSLIIHTVMSSNVLDAIFLYICFNKIKHQTEKLKKIIGKKAYELRKRYVKHCRFPVPEDTQKFLQRFETIFGLKMMVKSGLEKIILKFHDGLWCCCCPVQKNLPRKDELAWQVNRYL